MNTRKLASGRPPRNARERLHSLRAFRGLLAAAIVFGCCTAALLARDPANDADSGKEKTDVGEAARHPTTSTAISVAGGAHNLARPLPARHAAARGGRHRQALPRGRPAGRGPGNLHRGQALHAARHRLGRHHRRRGPNPHQLPRGRPGRGNLRHALQQGTRPRDADGRRPLDGPGHRADGHGRGGAEASSSSAMPSSATARRSSRART